MQLRGDWKWHHEAADWRHGAILARMCSKHHVGNDSHHQLTLKAKDYVDPGPCGGSAVESNVEMQESDMF